MTIFFFVSIAVLAISVIFGRILAAYGDDVDTENKYIAFIVLFAIDVITMIIACLSVVISGISIFVK